MLFKDRDDAGRWLATALEAYAGRGDTVVLGLPRGGVIVAEQVARRLAAPLDVFVVRKLGVPGQEELAMGAIASGGQSILNDEIVRALGISRQVIDEVAAREAAELERREREYRAGREPPDVTGKIVILVDDGLATGATMRAAVTALRRRQAAQIVVAVPVGPPDICQQMNRIADDVVCLITPQPFMGVGRWYSDFTQTTDDDVRAALQRAARRRDGAPAAPVHRSQGEAAAEIRRVALPLLGGDADYQPWLEAIGDARLVLIGEASHGTHEFYAIRAELTRRLIESKGFHAVAAEADWPDAYRVNRFVRGASQDAEAVEALAGFLRFPAWMWRNADVLDFVGWLREHNDGLAPGVAQVGFYGLDLYSLYGSIDAVIEYLEREDPEAARRARARYSCFDHFRDDVQRYGLEASLGLTKTCEDGAIQQLAELRRQAAELQASAPLEEEELFFAEQNARVVKNAEEYYRAMFRSRESSWNLRDRHMAETLEALMSFLDRRVLRSKVVVWAHNSHLGDARATEMGQRGELNVGQLVRQRHGPEDAVLVGFTTHSGTVTAASEWGGPAERKTVRPALLSSYEALFHEVGLPRFMLDLRASSTAIEELRRRRLERAIGVIYLPESERASHYFHAALPEQFDHVIHIDTTRALEPLERRADWLHGELPEPFPTTA